MIQAVLLFFNIGAPELFLIALVIIVFFGSKRIPELMRGLGKGIREFKDATGEIQKEIRKNAQVVEDEIGNPPENEGHSGNQSVKDRPSENHTASNDKDDMNVGGTSSQNPDRN